MCCIEPAQTRNVTSQLRRGTVEYCVLALLRDGDRYGFELVRALSDVDGLVTSEGTIYPLLTRLRKDELVTTFWRESESGPPRRYYQLTTGRQNGACGLHQGVEQLPRLGRCDSQRKENDEHHGDDRLVDEYLQRLEAAAAHMQRSRRVELVAEIREHIEAALREEDAATKQRCGTCSNDWARPRRSSTPPRRPREGPDARALEIAALVALVLPLIGWLFGIVLVLVSHAWSSRDKLVGIGLASIPALVPVLGVAASATLEASEFKPGTPIVEETGGDGGLGAAEVLVLVFGFFFAGLPSALFLGWRLRRS